MKLAEMSEGDIIVFIFIEIDVLRPLGRLNSS